jgi:hypothetical protein
MDQPSIAVEALDIQRIVAVSTALGTRRFGELLTILSMRLQGLSACIERLPEGAADLVLALHQSRGSAASLGLAGLAITLTDIEAQMAHLPDPAAMACIKIAGRTLHRHGHTAVRTAALHVEEPRPDHASGMCNR